MSPPAQPATPTSAAERAAAERIEARQAKWGFWFYLVFSVASAGIVTSALGGPPGPRGNLLLFGLGVFLLSCVGTIIAIVFVCTATFRRFGAGMLAACGILLLLGLAMCGVGK